MSAPDQTGLQQPGGYSNQGWYTDGRVVAGPPQGGYAPQGYPVQPRYGPQGCGPYQGQQVGYDEYVDRHGRIRKKNAGKLAACLVLLWCITWPCHGPCCGGL